MELTVEVLRKALMEVAAKTSGENDIKLQLGVFAMALSLELQKIERANSTDSKD